MKSVEGEGKPSELPTTRKKMTSIWVTDVNIRKGRFGETEPGGTAKERNQEPHARSEDTAGMWLFNEPSLREGKKKGERKSPASDCSNFRLRK